MSFRPAADGTLRQPVLCSPLSPPLPVQRMRLRSPFPLLRFDVAPDALARSLDAASRELDLPAASRSSDFYSRELVHQSDAAAAPVPRACRALWDELESRTLPA